MTWDGPDPYLEARTWSCGRCGGEAWPTDAAWLTGQLVLATFAQAHRGGCRAPRVWAILIDAEAAAPSSFPYPPADNSRRAREHYLRRPCRACGALGTARYCDACRCTGINGRSKRCANKAGPGGCCTFHSPGWAESVITGKQAGIRVTREGPK
jgi:hypothetical protein